MCPKNAAGSERAARIDIGRLIRPEELLVGIASAAQTNTDKAAEKAVTDQLSTSTRVGRRTLPKISPLPRVVRMDESMGLDEKCQFFFIFKYVNKKLC